MAEIALIVGAGSGLSASLARLCAREGMKVGLAARNVAKLQPLMDETGAARLAVRRDRAEPGRRLVLDAVERDLGAPDLVVFNAGYRTRGPVVELDIEEVRKTLISSARSPGSWSGRRRRARCCGAAMAAPSSSPAPRRA